MEGLLRIGVDIGQSRDPTAIVVAEIVDPHDRLRFEVWVRYIESLPLGTPYPEAAARVAEVALAARKKSGELRPIPLWTEVLCDATGVGRPVTEIVRGRLRLQDRDVRVIDCTFTHGDRCTFEDGCYKVGKAWLVSQLQVLLQTRRLHLPKTPEAEALAQELLVYEIKVDPDGHDRYGAFKVGTHDDLVTALGLCTLPARRVYVAR